MLKVKYLNSITKFQINKYLYSNLNFRMKVFLLLCVVLSIICSVYSRNSVVDNYIKGKASDTKVSCLMTVLAKINDDDPIVTDQPDFSKKI